MLYRNATERNRFAGPVEYIREMVRGWTREVENEGAGRHSLAVGSSVARLGKPRELNSWVCHAS